MTAQLNTVKKSRYRYLGVYLLVAGLIATIININLTIQKAKAEQFPLALAHEGFVPPAITTSFTMLGGLAVGLLIAAFILSIRNGLMLPSIVTSAVMMACILLAFLVIATPTLVSTLSTNSVASQNVFDQWAQARYGVDTTNLNVDDRSLLMKGPSSSQWITSEDTRAAKLPDGQLIQAVSDGNGARYLISALGGELPVIAGK